MAIRVVDNKHLTGLSTDVKPTILTSSYIELEEIFTETDTGNSYITHDGLSWESYIDVGSVSSSLYSDFALNKQDKILEAHATDKDKVVFKGSRYIPLKINSKMFYSSADVNINSLTDIDDYVADVVVEDGTGDWTESANVVHSTDAGKVKLHIEDAFATGIVGYKDFAAQDWSAAGKKAISFLITSSTNLGEGVLKIVYDEHSGCVSPSSELTIPALKANVQTRVILSMVAVAADRDAVISVGLKAISDPGHIDVWLDDIKITTLESGKDYYVYACDNGTLTFKVSANSTVPTGFTASTSRKVGGFHTLCLDVGTIAGHTLTTYPTGSILPASIWDLKHRPRSNPEGMVFVSAINKWADIYLTSGTGTSTASASGATISDTRDWNSFADDYAAVAKRLLDDAEFQAVAAGSNEETNIYGSADPVTTGKHLDTAARRMISNYGLEDCCGAMYQWLRDQSYRCDPDGTTIAAGLTFNVVHDDAPGGNPVYLKMSADGIYYLACNMAAAAADKYIGPANYKLPIKHEADPATGSIGQVYFDDDATQPARLLCNITTISKTVHIPTNNPAYLMQVTYSATASTAGVALYYDDGADNRLECNNASGATQALDLALNSQAFNWYDLAGTKGSLYKQGTYGDVKLLAGGSWISGTSCGSRCRYADNYRWDANATIGGRALSEPL